MFKVNLIRAMFMLPVSSEFFRDFIQISGEFLKNTLDKATAAPSKSSPSHHYW